MSSQIPCEYCVYTNTEMAKIYSWEEWIVIAHNKKNYVSPESDTVKQTFIQVVGKQSGKRFFQLSYFLWKG